MVNKCLINWPSASIILAVECKMSYNGMFLISFHFLLYAVSAVLGKEAGLFLKDRMSQCAVSRSKNRKYFPITAT